MPTHRQLVGRTIVGLLFVVMAAACSLFGPDLHITIDNKGPKEVTMTVDESGRGLGGEDAGVPPWTRMEATMRLGSTWEVKVDGNHVIGSGDQTVLALPSPGQGQDVTVSIRFDADGSMTVQTAR